MNLEGIQRFFEEERWSVPIKQEEFTATDHSFRIDELSENNPLTNENIKITFDDTQSYLSDESFDLNDPLTNENIKIEFDDTQSDLSDESFDEDEDLKVNYCENCKEMYEDYCSKCTMLSRILDTPVEFNAPNRAKKTLPKNILDMKFHLKGKNGIYALKPIPGSVIFGPVHGLSTKNSGSDCSFNITRSRNGLLGKETNFNWMRYINLAGTVLQYNLRAFQYNNDMYFQSIKRIDKGEELIISYEIDWKDLQDGKYYKPPVEDKNEDIYACVSCCLGFSARKHLIDHMMTCSNRKADISNKIVHCSTCQLYLSEDEFSNGHEVSCARIKKSRLMSFCRRSGQLEVDFRKFKCPKCNYTTSCLTTLQEHYNGNQHENCETLQETIESSNQIRKSKTVDEKEEDEVGEEVKRKTKCGKCEGKKYVCPICDKKFAAKSYLRHHDKIHTGEKRFFCAICDFGALAKPTLESHIKNVHFKDTIEKTYQCNMCPFKTHGRSSFKNHSRIHLGIKQHVCDVCEKAFLRKNHLNRHKLKHTDERNFLCSQCEKTFRTNDQLKVHVYHCHTEKPYECDHCNFKSRTKENFDQHMKKKHPDGGVDKKFKCSQCKYQTNEKGNYNKHVNNHNGYRPFACEICEKGFLLKSDLRKHIRWHSGEKDYKCHDCGKSFVTKQTLGTHLSLHTGDKRLKCSQCDFQTNIEKLLHEHKVKAHES